MLGLTSVVKDYKVADTSVRALKGVSLYFRKSEFVSILGPSGCGKTTLLNIIGGTGTFTATTASALFSKVTILSRTRPCWATSNSR